MPILYTPAGAAREYSPLAANLYRGCSHGCRYCYAPACTRTPPERFAQSYPRKDVLAQLEKDVAKWRGPKRPVLLCFTCDPYQPLEADHHITREAITILGKAGFPIRVLTKRPSLAVRDLDWFWRYQVEVGVSLVWYHDERRQEWEPNTDPVDERVNALWDLKEAGVRTWVSMEPVVDPAEARLLLVDKVLHESVGTWKIGKLNHLPEARAVDWFGFLRDLPGLLAGKRYYIKRELWAQGGDLVDGLERDTAGVLAELEAE